MNSRPTRTLVKQEIDIAKQLKQAIEDEDDDRQLELKEKLRQVDVQREQLELRIGENNRARRGQELQSISLGNQRVGTAEINTQIDLSRIDSPAVDDLTDQRAVNDFIKARKVERDNINSQIDQTKSEKDQLRGIAREARRSLNEIERTEERAAEELSGPIESILQAQQEVGRVASAISSSGLSGALQQPLRPDSPDAKVVQRLLGS